MKQKPSKLDQFAESLLQMDGEKKTLADIVAWLKAEGVSVSCSRVSDFLESLRAAQLQERLLNQIASGSQHLQKVEATLAKNPAPELETLIKLHRVLIMKLSTMANVDAELFEIVSSAMKPVMKFAELQEKKASREFDKEKFTHQIKSDIERGLDALFVEIKGNKAALELFHKFKAVITNAKAA
jgi:hypothetical protein